MKLLLRKESIKKNILLVAIWGTVIVTGFLALGANVGNVEHLAVFGRLHSVSVRLGFVFTVIHIFCYRKQIIPCLRFKIDKTEHDAQMAVVRQSKKSNRVVKAITAVAFHIILHIISIHLVVAYTTFHVIQHRRGIASIFKKKPFRLNRCAH